MKRDLLSLPGLWRLPHCLVVFGVCVARAVQGQESLCIMAVGFVAAAGPSTGVKSKSFDPLEVLHGPAPPPRTPLRCR
jgi:hypothetical protein